MNILFSTFELAPFTKVGGLADVMGSMPKALRKLGCNIKIFAPFIGSINVDELWTLFRVSCCIAHGYVDVYVYCACSSYFLSDAERARQ